ncbi:MAG: ribosome biogenesis GTPase YlqF [Anaerovoracaceae bacterium]
MAQTINWYPGHMKKAVDLISNHLKLVDLVIEILDSRIPVSSKNPIIDEIIGSKPKVTILNKYDLADEEVNELWVKHIENRNVKALLTDCKSGKGLQKLISYLSDIQKQRNIDKKMNRPLRIMVLGIPNVGKSSFINRMSGRQSTQIGNKPGVTKGKQWITIANGMQLLDMPGILWPKFEDINVGLKLSFCGSIKDEILDIEEVAFELLRELSETYPKNIIERYDFDSLNDNTVELMEEIAEKRGFLKKGGLCDYNRTAYSIVQEFRGGRFGRISLERP